jgi:alkylation response protein AidB-like acyl-CoA dehydrogenase
MIPDDFGYGEDQSILRREARKVLEAECPLETVRKLMETPAGYDEAMWKRMAEMGWLGLAVPEEHGGSDLSMVSLATLAEEMGRALLPSPFLGTLFAALVIREAGSEAQKAAWLPKIAAGDLKGAVAITEEEGGWDPAAVKSTATKGADGIALAGAKTLVLDAPSADLIIGTFREREGVSLFAVEAGARGVSVSPDSLVDATRRSALVRFEGAVVPESARLGEPGSAQAALAKVMPRVWTALAAEMAGGADRILGITVDYAKVREQFDRQIGAFQAVKHPLVDVMVSVEMTRSLLYRAAAAIDHEPSSAERLSRMAKALASDCYSNATARAVQLHGGIGFTWECDVHLFFKRAQWSKFAFGDAAHHRKRIADLVIGAPPA